MPPTPMRSSSSYRVTWRQSSMPTGLHAKTGVGYDGQWTGSPRFSTMLSRAAWAPRPRSPIGDGGREVGPPRCAATRRTPARSSARRSTTARWFDLASVTKPMATAAIAMVLVGERRLDLDAPDPRAGSPAAATTGDGSPAARPRRRLRRPRRVLPRTCARRDPPNPRDELVAARRARAVRAHPASPRVYSDLGFIMLGAIIERAADGRSRTRSPSWSPGRSASARATPGLSPIAPRVATELDESTASCAGSSFTTRTAFFGGGVVRPRRAVRDDRRRRDVRGGDCRHRGRRAARPAARPTWSTVRDRRASPGSAWRLGWDTPSATPGVSHAGDRWPRAGAVGHTGFTGTSLWLDLPRRRWVALLTNRVHPTRHGGTAERIKRCAARSTTRSSTSWLG